jgi:hypothetical protein
MAVARASANAGGSIYSNVEERPAGLLQVCCERGDSNAQVAADPRSTAWYPPYLEGYSALQVSGKNTETSFWFEKYPSASASEKYRRASS